MTPRQLLDLRPGAILLVKIGNRAEPVRVSLLGNPALYTTGVPGTRRIGLVVLDLDHQARRDAWEAKQGPGFRGHGIFSKNPAKHSIRGDAVEAIES